MKAILILFAGLTIVSCTQKPTEIAVVSALHGAHNTNPNYSYEDLYTFIEQYNPDIVGVEIRPEDIDSSVNYLNNFYPLEMYEIRDKFNERQVVGIDWLGESIESKAIPEGYFKGLDILQLAEQAEQDTLFKSKLASLDSLAEKKEHMVLSANIQEINGGEYDSLNALYYELMDKLYTSTPYQPVSDFYGKRDQKITENILRTISENPGKRIIFILGADHRNRAFKAIEDLPQEDILITEIRQP